MRPKIVQFFENSQILGIKNLSHVQKMTLKAIMGESLDSKTPIPKTHPFQEKEFESELEMFKYFSGKDEYIPKFYSDADLCWGRRSGKSTTIGAGLTIYFATQFDYSPYLGTSPHATIPLISPTKEQANEVYQSIKNMFLRSPYLFKNFLGGKIENFQDEFSEDDLKQSKTLSGGSIKLTNKVVIKVMTADISKTRGFAAPFVILDEVNFFGAEGNDLKNTDKAIYEALAPALSQFQTVEGMAMVLKISSPNGQTGLMFENFENKKDTDVLHLQVPSWYANPTLSIAYLEKQKKKGSSYFNREYGAQYTASEASYLDPNMIDVTIIRGMNRIEFDSKYRYAAAIDYASRGDYWTLAIGHKEDFFDPEEKTKKERVQIDLLKHWRGSDGKELDPSKIVPEICMYLKAYQIANCVSDQYNFAGLRPFFQKEGCILKEFKITTQSKAKFMYSLQIAVNSSQLKIVNNSIAVKQLKDLREKRTTSTGVLKIEAAQGSHDDYPIVIGLVVYQFDKTSPIYLGFHKEEEPTGPPSKDALGRQLLVPTAPELAEHVGLYGFHDSRDEKSDDDEDNGGMSWVF